MISDIDLDNVRHSVDDIVLNILDTPPPHLPVRVASVGGEALDLYSSDTGGQSNQSDHTENNLFI